MNPDSPPSPGAPASANRLGLAIASLVFGILALVLSLFLIGILFGLVGLLLGMFYLRQRQGPKRVAWWGVSLSTLVLLVAGTVRASAFE